MADFSYKQIGVELDLSNWDTVNDNFKDIGTDMTNVQSQLDVLVVEGDSSPEAAQARVDVNGNIYASLKSRLDADKRDTELKFGSISVAQINKNLGKFDQTYLSDQLLAQIAGTAGINAMPLDDSISTQKITNQAITPEKTNMFQVGKNLFDKTTITSGQFINHLNGTLSTSANYNASDFIAVTPGQQYTRNFSHTLAWYDAGKNYISGQAQEASAGTTTTITAPANARYLRITAPLTSSSPTNLNTFQVEKGTNATVYESYRFLIPKQMIPDENIAGLDGIKLVDKSVSFSKVKEVESSKNLFNKRTITASKFVDWQTGNLVTNTGYNASDYIEVQSSTPYFVSFGHQIAFYNASKVYVGGVNLSSAGISGGTFTTPTTAKFARVSVANDKVNSYQMEAGTTKTTYAPYGYKINDLNIKDTLLVFLPNEICVAVGRTVELYNSQVSWTGNIDNYHFNWKCAVGKNMKRKWSCTGVTEKVGNHAMTLTVYDNDMNVVAEATTTVKIVNFNLATTKNVLVVGDSLTNGKPWLLELRNLSASKLNFVGTRFTSMNGDPLLSGQRHEGRSGVTSAWYLTDSTYTFDPNGPDNKNPFWNPATSQFDYNYYKTNYGVSPNAIQLFLGTNGIALDPTANATNIKGIVDGIRASDSTIPIFVIFTLYRSNQDGIGQQLNNDGYSAGNGVWELEEKRKVYNLMVKVYELLNGYSNLWFTPIALAHDSEYNFGAVATPVNPRASQTELLPIESVHPQLQGYQQMADIMFSAFAAHLS